jgi:hypothetical protein
MLEVIQRQQFGYWSAAARGELPDWDEVFAGYAAAVDWPAAAYWPEIVEAYPDAVVLLSTRASAEEWYRSAAATIFAIGDGPGDPAAMAGIFARFGADPHDPDAAMAAYEAHNQRVRHTVAPERLVEWQPGDGWEPLCAALGTAVPDEAFPHVNTTAMFEERLRQMRSTA